MLSINVKINYPWAFPSQHKQPLYCYSFLMETSTQITFFSCVGGGISKEGATIMPRLQRFHLPHPTCSLLKAKSLPGHSELPWGGQCPMRSPHVPARQLGEPGCAPHTPTMGHSLQLRSVFQNTLGGEAASFRKHNSPSSSIDNTHIKPYTDIMISETQVLAFLSQQKNRGNNQMLCSIT